MRRGKWKHFVIVNFLLVILILNATSLSATDRMSAHRAFADDCYDSDGHYICTDMSDSSSGDSRDDSSGGNTGGDSGSDSGDSSGGDNSGDSSGGNTGSDSSNDLTDGNTGNDGSPDTSGISNVAHKSGETEGDSGTNCSDEEGGFVCATPMPDENSPDNPDNPSTDEDKSSDNGGNRTDNNHVKQITPPGKCDNNSTCSENCGKNNDLCDNGKPKADAGPDKEVSEGNSITIDGSQSNDPDGDNLQYNWNVNDAGLEVGNQESAKLEVKASEVQADSYYTISLTVTDKDGNSDSDQMSLKVTDTNNGKTGINPEPVPCEGNMTSDDGCQQPTPEPVPCEGNMTSDDGCQQPTPEPVPCEGNMTSDDGCQQPTPEPVPCEGNMTSDDGCQQPTPEPVPCDEDTNYTNPDCPPAGPRTGTMRYLCQYD